MDHEDHLKVLDQVLDRLQTNNLKINLDKCFFGNKEVSYLGFTLTPEGIKPGKNKLKAIKDALALVQSNDLNKDDFSGKHTQHLFLKRYNEKNRTKQTT